MEVKGIVMKGRAHWVFFSYVDKIAVRQNGKISSWKKIGKPIHKLKKFQIDEIASCKIAS